ncbi:MAG: aminotransferase class I/II-fold pyridoxal phosphate-dependent enzyme [Pseudomonadota bacterium]
MTLARRSWVPEVSEAQIQRTAHMVAQSEADEIHARIDALTRRNLQIHEIECFNLNPASNVMNPRAEALLAAGLSSRASLGYPGDKYETGLEAIEEIETIAAELAAEIFNAQYVESRVASGAAGNLYAFMATCRPGDTIIAPPPEIGGHVTHHEAGCAGLYGLRVLPAPVHADGYTVDLDGLRDLARRETPRLITIGGSLNLFAHPVTEVREIADEIGAYVLFDAAHQCGIIAGGAWPDPLAQGAHLMTMSTYKSLGGPAGGLVLTSDKTLAKALDRIAFPGMTANFDAGITAALAVTLLDWRVHGADYAHAMITVARALATELDKRGVPIFAAERGYTRSHQFALRAAALGGGQSASRRLRRAGFLTCGIGLPVSEVEGDLNGLRIGTPEIVRWGVTEEHAPALADLIAEALSGDADAVGPRTADLRRHFAQLHYVL